MVRFAALLLMSASLAACTSPRAFNFSRDLETPSVTVAASVQVVRDVITDSASQRGSAVALVGDGLVLERPLASSSPEVVSACGPHRPGRATRTVLRTRAVGPAQTQLTEERYVVDRGATCAVPLLREDLAQSRAALTRIKVQAEAVQARIRSVETALR